MNHILRTGVNDRGGLPVVFANTTENTKAKSSADSHSPDYQFSQSQRTVSISGTEYQPSTYYQQEAHHRIQDLSQTIASRDCVPVIYPPFPEEMADDIARMSDQQTQRRYENGSFELAKAYLELMCILKSPVDAKKEMDIVELKNFLFKKVREDSLAWLTLSLLSRIESIYHSESFSGTAFRLIPIECRIGFNESRFLGISKEDWIELHVMCVKLCSFIKLHNLMPKVNLCRMVVSDLYLFRRSTGHVFLPLYFNPSQFLRWLETCSTLDSIMPDCTDSSCLFECNDFSICSTMNHFFWTHGKAEYILETTDVIPLEILNDYYKHYLTEDELCRLLFSSPEQASPSTVRQSLTDESRLNKSDVLFGEEFEFIPPDVPGQKYYSQEKCCQLLRNFKEKFESLMQDKGINNYQASICEKHHGNKLSYETSFEFTCSLGPWQMKFFQDGCQFEFNATPYRINQTFPLTVNGNTRLWTPYKMFDEFIHKPFRSMGAKGCSGHKHFDVMSSFNGNVGLLFRTLSRRKFVFE